jgi:putative addiction module CopG family antidote
MEVSLTAELEAFIQEKVQTGRYADASAVVREALRMLEQNEDFASPALEATLLEGIQSPHRAYGADTLERVRRSVPAR